MHMQPCGLHKAILVISVNSGRQMFCRKSREATPDFRFSALVFDLFLAHPSPWEVVCGIPVVFFDRQISRYMSSHGGAQKQHQSVQVYVQVTLFVFVVCCLVEFFLLFYLDFIGRTFRFSSLGIFELALVFNFSLINFSCLSLEFGNHSANGFVLSCDLSE